MPLEIKLSPDQLELLKTPLELYKKVNDKVDGEKKIPGDLV